MKDKYIITLKELLIKREIHFNHQLSLQETELFATEFDLKKVESLLADFKIFPIYGNKGIGLKGKIKGKVIHHCVVTLGPVPQLLDESVYVHFTPTGQDDIAENLNKNDIAELDLSQEYDVEQLHHSQINVFDIIREYFSLSLLTLPRVANANFSGYVSGDLTSDEKEIMHKNVNRISEGKLPVSAENPFARLKQLKEQIK